MSEDAKNAAPAPESGDAGTSTNQDLILEKMDKVTGSYDALEQKFHQDLGDLKGQVGELTGMKEQMEQMQNNFGEFQTTFADKFDSFVNPPKPKPELVPDPASSTIFSDDGLYDANRANQELGAYLQKLEQKIVSQVAPSEQVSIEDQQKALIEALTPVLEAREQKLQAQFTQDTQDKLYADQVRREQDSLVANGANPELVKYAAWVNEQKPENEKVTSLTEALNNLKTEQAHLFVQETSEKTVANMVGDRKQVPLDHGIGLPGNEDGGKEFDNFFREQVIAKENPLSQLSS